ncbi:unnamed protein product [Discula destructiva]
MTEAWDDLANFRAQRSRCAADVAFITSDCARDHPQCRHVLECRECYQKVIDRMRSRYLDPKDGVAREWFSGRDGFLRDLDELFGAVRQRKASLEEVDARLEEGRRRWYEQRVRASPSIRKSLEELVDKRDVFAKVGASGVPFEAIVAEIREALEIPAAKNREHGAQDVERTLQRLMEANTPEERTQVYKETFFQSRPNEPASAKTQAYLSRLQDGATMDEIIKKISVDRRSSIGALDQKERHRQRVEELRRAKNAHELEKTKKARQDSSTRPQPPDDMYDQPPCHACGRELDLQDFTACPLCSVLADKGIHSKSTVFCSAACVSGPDGQEAHMERAHDCAGGEYCAQLIDEDVDMDMHASGPFLCRECTNGPKRETVWCSLRCAHMNFQSHREGVHVPERKLRGLDSDRDIESLVFDREDRTRYHARNIRVHLAPLEEMLLDFQQRNAIEVSENGYHE